MANSAEQKEHWDYVPNFPTYLVSDQGKILALQYQNRPKCKILDLNCNNGRYIKVTLTGETSQKTFWVHQLVAEVFCNGKDEEHNQVDHINGDRYDNRADNLRWVSGKENCQNPNTLHRGYHISDEGRRHMSDGQKRRFQRPEERARMLERLAKGRAEKRKRRPPRNLDGPTQTQN